MNLKNKKHAILVSLLILSLIAAAVAGIWILAQDEPTTKAQDKNTQQQKPAFVFDKTKAPGWWSGGNNWPDIKDFTSGHVTKDDISVASISVGQGEYGKPGNCFVDYYYWDKNVDPTQALIAMEERSIKGMTNVQLTPRGVHPLKIDTPEGTKEYQLHQYEFTGAGSSTFAKGAQFGYIPLTKGHIEIRSYCNTADQLPNTATPLTAVSLKK